MAVFETSRKCLESRRLTYAAVKDLAEKLTSAPRHLTTATVWQAYRRLEAAKVRGAASDKMLTDIIALVRFATGTAEALEPLLFECAKHVLELSDHIAHLRARDLVEVLGRDDGPVGAAEPALGRRAAGCAEAEPGDGLAARAIQPERFV